MASTGVGSAKVLAFDTAGSGTEGGVEVGPTTGVSYGFSSSDIF